MDKNIRPRSKLFKALGYQDPPSQIQIIEKIYHLVKIYKHDSWAATALYEGEAGKVVCKFNRQQSIFGLPMKWLGKRLAHRENKLLQLFSDLPNIPNYCGEVKVAGRLLENASAHLYVEGTPLKRYPMHVDDQFFPELFQVLKIIHSHQISYMDMNKQENIIVDTKGHPCLIDFQICFHLPKRWPGNNFFTRYLLKLLQQSDEYHLMKHFRRLRPDLFTPEQMRVASKRPWFLNIYRSIQIPLRTLRRLLLVVLGFRDRSGKATSEAFVEDGMKTNSHEKN